MRLKDLAESTSDLFNLPLASIAVDPTFNVRTDSPEVREHVRQLADDIRANGFLRSKPLIVRLVNDQAMVVDGHCRLAAVHLAVSEGADIVSLPCLPEPKGTTEADRTVMLLKANAGLPLAHLEQAEVVKRLVSYGWSDTKIADKIGRSRQHVANLLTLAGAPSEVLAMVTDGTVSPTQALRTVRQEGAAGAVVALAKARDQAAASGRTRVTPRAVRAVCAESKGEQVRTADSQADSVESVSFENADTVADGTAALVALRDMLDWWAEAIADEQDAAKDGTPSTYDASNVAEWFFGDFVPKAQRILRMRGRA